MAQRRGKPLDDEGIQNALDNCEINFESSDGEEDDVLEYDDLSDSVLATIMPTAKTAVKIYKIKKLKNSLNLSK